MSTSINFPHEFRIPVSQELIRNVKDPHLEGLSILHALVKVRDIPNGRIPDKINPRSHDVIKMSGRIPMAIEKTLTESPELFHLLNRGCLVLAKKAWYDNQTKMLHFVIESDEEQGMVDGATTDRVLECLKNDVNSADFYSLKEEEIPDYFKEAYIHIEVVSGDIEQDLRIQLADARNTSEQVKEFSLQDLGHKFDWLKDILENSKFRGKIRYRENEQNPVDIRIVLALLTLFHPQWLKLNRDPIVAYTGKGAVLDLYKEDKKESGWREGYEKLAPVVVDVLELYEFLHVEFKNAYIAAGVADGTGAKLGLRKEVHYTKKAKVLPLTGLTTQYVIADGWLYPLLSSFRMLLDWPKSGRGDVKWVIDPKEFFKLKGPDLVSLISERSLELGRNPNAIGKSKGVWSGLRIMVDNWLLRENAKALN